MKFNAREMNETLEEMRETVRESLIDKVYKIEMIDKIDELMELLKHEELMSGDFDGGDFDADDSRVLSIDTEELLRLSVLEDVIPCAYCEYEPLEPDYETCPECGKQNPLKRVGLI